jgi:alkylation response protein AidB-like acyl-CoA dehydrogenase
VESDDPRIKGTCMVILEETDAGVFDRGTPTRKLVHQLSSTRDPIFNLRVPASRIIGGYTVRDGVMFPRYNHGEIIEAVFRRTRVTVAIMTSAKLLSAIEPVIRYHRNRFRGGGIAQPGSPRYELGLQLKQDVVHRLVDVWAAGEASASLGFEAARVFDQLDPLEKDKAEIFAARGITGGTALIKAMRQVQKDAIEVLQGRRPDLTRDPLVRFALLDSVANVLLPCVQAVEHGPRRPHDARGGEPNGRLRHHRGLSRFPGTQVDGFAAGSHL